MSRPRLTAKVVRGLGPCIALIEVNLTSAIVTRGKVEHSTDLVQSDATPQEIDDIASALIYLSNLAMWHKEKDGVE
tara:strand:+ start:76 stop:303 length:228 start_codon:yes stop_codon:yes gene_type:complete